MTRHDTNEANVVQQGLNTLADVAGASEGNAPVVGSDGTVEFGATGVIETAAVPISSARIKTLFTTPLEVIPAPGPGKMIFLIGHLCQLKYVAPAYTIAGSGQPNFAYAGNEANSFNTLADVTITAAANHCDADWGGIFGSVFNDQVIVENKAITFFVTNANPAAGNGTLIVNIYYITVDLA